MRKWILSLGGAGLLPFMPGTMGSLASCGIVLIVYSLISSPAAPIGVLAWAGVLIAMMLFFSWLCVALGSFAIETFGKKDPGAMVLDEAAGICLTMLFQPIAPGIVSLKTIFVAFLAFRVFDIVKPPPARQLEMLPAGWGILMDDLMAAVYANIVCQAILRLWLLKDLTHA